jgi:hypothetical protein
VPYPDLGRWVNAVIECGGKTAAARLQQALQSREGLKEDFVYLFTFYNASNARILIIIFTHLFSF